MYRWRAHTIREYEDYEFWNFQGGFAARKTAAIPWYFSIDSNISWQFLRGFSIAL
jgi:hypothetical protein